MLPPNSNLARCRDCGDSWVWVDDASCAECGVVQPHPAHLSDIPGELTWPNVAGPVAGVIVSVSLLIATFDLGASAESVAEAVSPIFAVVGGILGLAGVAGGPLLAIVTVVLGAVVGAAVGSFVGGAIGAIGPVLLAGAGGGLVGGLAGRLTSLARLSAIEKARNGLAHRNETSYREKERDLLEKRRKIEAAIRRNEDRLAVRASLGTPSPPRPVTADPYLPELRTVAFAFDALRAERWRNHGLPIVAGFRARSSLDQESCTQLARETVAWCQQGEAVREGLALFDSAAADAVTSRIATAQRMAEVLLSQAEALDLRDHAPSEFAGLMQGANLEVDTRELEAELELELAESEFDAAEWERFRIEAERGLGV